MAVQRLRVSSSPLPLYGSAASREIERRVAALLAPHTLMQRAGQAVAQLARALAPHAQRIWVAAGPGNNGGDGLEAASLLRQTGCDVRVSLVADCRRMPDDARASLQRAQAAGTTIDWLAPDDRLRTAPALGPQDLAIDALLGLGANRAPTGALASLMQQLDALSCRRLAVDVPSGLDPDTGQPRSGMAVNASHTLSLLTLKPGLFTAAGRDHAGELWFDNLGDADPGVPPDAWLTGHDPAALPARRASSHKGSFGDVAVIGGAAGMSGAALLAARAAHAAGAGRVIVELLAPLQSEVDLLRPELMLRAGWSRSPAASLANTTVVCGCGGGDAVRAALPRLLASVPRLVLDADALNAIAADKIWQTELAKRLHRGATTVLTPHPLEAARLLGCGAGDVQADRLSAARQLADRFQCVVVLKGSGSVIAAPDSRPPCINATGSAALASAGTGDVLAGWLGGLWAQWPSAGTDAAFDVACHAVASHGAAAQPLQPGALRAADLVEVLHERLRQGR